MNDVKKNNSSTLGNKEIAVKFVNAFFNAVGILFFVSFMGYMALHCI